MVGYGSNISFLILWVLWLLNLLSIGLLVTECSLLNSFESLPILQRSSNWFMIAYPISPFQWPFHPKLGLWFLTSLMIYFSQYAFPNIVMRSRSILPSTLKLLSFRLIRFWRHRLFNYPLTFTLYFPILNSLDWHGTKGVPSLDVSWAYVSNINSIRWVNPMLLVR